MDYQAGQESTSRMFKEVQNKMVQNSPTVSVIIPTYNRAHLIGRAIKSVLSQTYRDFEVIVVDDGSTDNTEEVLRNFKDENEKIKYIRHKENRGGSAARNTGIKNARGQYLAFLDSDDEWLPEKLEKQINIFCKCPDSVGVVYCLPYMQYDPSRYMRKVNIPNLSHSNMYKFLLKDSSPIVLTSLFMLSKRVFEKSGMFDERLPCFQDHDLWIRVAKYYEFEFVDKHLVIIHQHLDSSLSRNIETLMKGLPLFLEKWGNVMKREVGCQAYAKFKNKQISKIYRKEIINNLLISQWLPALKCFKKLIKARGISINFLIKLPVALMGNTKLYNFFRRNYRMFKYK